MVHGLEEWEENPSVLRQADEDVGVGVPGAQLGIGELVAVPNRVAEAQPTAKANTAAA